MRKYLGVIVAVTIGWVFATVALIGYYQYREGHPPVTPCPFNACEPEP